MCQIDYRNLQISQKALQLNKNLNKIIKCCTNQNKIMKFGSSKFHKKKKRERPQCCKKRYKGYINLILLVFKKIVELVLGIGQLSLKESVNSQLIHHDSFQVWKEAEI